MAIRFTCACGKSYEVADNLAGRKGKCKACGEVFTVPAAEGPEPTDVDPETWMKMISPDAPAADAPAGQVAGAPATGETQKCFYCGEPHPAGQMALDAHGHPECVRCRAKGLGRAHKSNAKRIGAFLIAGVLLTGVLGWAMFWPPKQQQTTETPAAPPTAAATTSTTAAKPPADNATTRPAPVAEAPKVSTPTPAPPTPPKPLEPLPVAPPSSPAWVRIILDDKFSRGGKVWQSIQHYYEVRERMTAGLSEQPGETPQDMASGIDEAGMVVKDFLAKFGPGDVSQEKVAGEQITWHTYGPLTFGEKKDEKMFSWLRAAKRMFLYGFVKAAQEGNAAPTITIAPKEPEKTAPAPAPAPAPAE